MLLPLALFIAAAVVDPRRPSTVPVQAARDGAPALAVGDGALARAATPSNSRRSPQIDAHNRRWWGHSTTPANVVSRC
jgi:hypothetical protein